MNFFMFSLKVDRYRACTDPGKPGKSWNFTTSPGKFWKSLRGYCLINS